MKILTRVLAGGIAVAAIAACSGGSSETTPRAPLQAPALDLPANGNVVGRFLAVGGPYGAQPSPLRGRVSLTKNGEFQSGALSSRSGWFSVSAPQGVYVLAGTSSQFTGNGHAVPCLAADRIRLHAGETVHMNIYYQRR